MRIIDISNDVLSAEVYEGDPVPERGQIQSQRRQYGASQRNSYGRAVAFY